MNIFAKQYIKNLVGRYDKEVGIPYFSYKNFEGIHFEPGAFQNSRGVEIHYFFYYYDNYKNDKIVLFCPGIGPGHTAYLNEINHLAKGGYKVLTLDYTGCGESKGEILGSLNMPTLDVIDLLNKFNLKENIVLMGHSLGAYTSLNLLNAIEGIKKAVIMSGFVTIKDLMKRSLKSGFLANQICKYEKETVPEYYGLDNISYLKTTKDKIFFIQSEDDPVVPFECGYKVYEAANNPNIKLLKFNNRKHNPNYTDSAVKYMHKSFAIYRSQIKKKIINTDEDKINYFKNISIEKVTEQDEKLFGEIIAFID